ncbi:MAG: FkbM family methyltransferase [Anaerolineales bacterium]
MIRYGFKFAVIFLENILIALFSALIFWLPARVKANLKNKLNPKVKLDYRRHTIFLCADSEWSLRRARACEKEPETVAWIEKFMQPAEVFYDIGANVGAYSLVASKYFQGNIKVFSFEPSFSTYAQLCRNIVLNNCQGSVFPYPFLLADKLEIVHFKYQSLEGGSAEHSLSKNQGDDNVGKMATAAEYQQQLLSFPVDYLVTTLRFPPPNHMKVDVDGAELLVLQGALQTLAMEQLKSVLVEVRQYNGQAEVVLALLGDSGFKLHSRYDRGDGIIWNYIFVK